MIAKKKLFEAYETWSQLTQAESTAIKLSDWARVAECQNSKQVLQKQIISLTESAQAERIETGLDSTNFERDLRPIINNLISMESRNAAKTRKLVLISASIEMDQQGLAYVQGILQDITLLKKSEDLKDWSKDERESLEYMLPTHI